jgi:hypothetical protein
LFAKISNGKPVMKGVPAFSPWLPLLEPGVHTFLAQMTQLTASTETPPQEKREEKEDRGHSQRFFTGTIRNG